MRVVSAVALGILVLGGSASPGSAEEELRFAVGPFQPTPSETRKTYEPFFNFLGAKLGRPHVLTVANDWAGIATALANGQVDVAWMGPWGYVLAHNQGGGDPVAMVKYDGSPTYHAIIVARPDLEIKRWPEDARGLRMSFADVGSTSGWLIPTYWFKSRGIDPASFFRYRDGASHVANEIAVATGQIDLATDYDRNRTAMIELGTLKPDATKVVWTSDPLPNDPLVVRAGLDAAVVSRVKELVLSMSEEDAKTLMPPHYTGWVAATDESYRMITQAGITVGKLKAP